MLLEDLRRRFAVVEELTDFVDLLRCDLQLTKGLGENACRRNELHHKTKGSPCADRGKLGESVFFNFDALCGATDRKDLDDFI